MENLSKTNREKRILLIGCEVYSIKYEGVVSVKRNGDVKRSGEVVDVLNTNSKVSKLWKEYINTEL